MKNSNKELKVKLKTWYAMEKEFGLNTNGNIKCRQTFTKEMRYIAGRSIHMVHRDKKTFIELTSRWIISIDMMDHEHMEEVTTFLIENKLL